MKKKQLKDKAIRGIAWSSASAMVSKLASLGTQLVLGWLLSKDDFGVYAFSIGLATCVAGLRNGGTTEYLIQKCEAYTDWLKPCLFFSILSNFSASLILLLIVSLAADRFTDPRILPVAAIVAATIPLGTWPALLRARMSVELRFEQLALISGITNVSRQVLVVIFAVVGFGPFSFVLPLLILPFLEIFMMRRRLTSIELTGEVNLRTMLEVAFLTRYIMLGNFLNAVARNGDYFVIGLFITASQLGIYFFSYQLTLATVTLLFTNIQSILLPSYSHLIDAPKRQEDAILRSIRVASALAAPMVVVAVLWVREFVHIAWGGRWDEAGPLIEIFMLCLIAGYMGPIVRAAMEARGLWVLRMIFIALDAGAFIVIVTIASIGEDILVLACAVGLYRAMFDLFMAKVLSYVLRIKTSVVVRNMGWPYFLGLATGCVLVAFAPSGIDLIGSLYKLGIALVGIVIYVRWITRDSQIGPELQGLLSSVVGRSRA